MKSKSEIIYLLSKCRAISNYVLQHRFGHFSPESFS